ncbi:MAG: hypothetical protein H7X76_06505 [Prolixibacteraceae bacterium]|nr:hypothetical protein [Burkholderiales bacterium]
MGSLTTSHQPPSSIGFDSRAIWSSYLYGLIVPVIFIALKAISVPMLPLAWAKELLSLLSKLAPVLQQHLTILSEAGRTTDIANYPVFLLASLLCCCVPIAKVISTYVGRWRCMPGPPPLSAYLLITIIFGMFFILTVLEFDAASRSFRSIYQLYFDKAGLYYVRQFALVFLFSVGLLALTLLLLSLISVAARAIERLRRR